MFPFKVQLFQGCKSKPEPINTKSVVQHVIRYQVLLAAYYKTDTKYCCCRAACYTIPSIVSGILQSRYQVLLRRAKRRQFPKRLAFSTTVNKSQGQTFDKICLYLPKPVFSPGQLYVALLRVRSLGSLSVVSETNGIVNCVYNGIYMNK
jgi:hypothetical protein